MRNEIFVLLLTTFEVTNIFWAGCITSKSSLKPFLVVIFDGYGKKKIDIFLIYFQLTKMFKGRKNMLKAMSDVYDIIPVGSQHFLLTGCIVNRWGKIEMK